MDQFLLQAVVTEAQRRLIDHEVIQVSFLGRSRYLLRFATSAKDNLLISMRPDLPRFHLCRARRVQEETPDRFAAYLDQRLAGAVLTALEKRPWDRILELRFRLPRQEDGDVELGLVVELLGSAANLIVLDSNGLVLAFCRQLKSDFRAPVAGRSYAPPSRRERLDAIPPGPEALPLIQRDFGGARAFLEEVSPLFARDLEMATARIDESDRRLAELLGAVRAGSWSPTVYSIRPLAEMTEADAPGKDQLLVTPLPLLAPPRPGDRALVSMVFESPSEAAEAGFGLLERQRDFKDLRDHHTALVRKEIGRLQSLCGKLEKELEGARGSDRFRRQGEALLAGLSRARVEGEAAYVPDPYDPAGGTLGVPIDPSLSLQENARLLFDRYKKGKRGVVTIEKRLHAALARLGEWRELAAPASAIQTMDDLDRLRDQMARLGLVHAPRSSKTGASPRPKEEPTRVRRYLSPDGLTILVGKSGAENDTLTFRVAAPADFWLHAADRPGAHVVVRNPQRLKTLPERSLRAAAEIAAYHSGARQESKVEVHYTQRKHVHKSKGMPSGRVLLRRFRTIQVAPRIPTSSVEEV